MKLGIPQKLISKSDDPFLELNKLIFENDAVSERYESLYGKRKIIFDVPDERIFIINKLSDIFNKSSNYIKGESFCEIISNRVNELLLKYKKYVKFDYDIALVHLNSTHDTVYVSATDSVKEKIYVPHICIPSMVGFGCVVIPIKLFVENKLYG